MDLRKASVMVLTSSFIPFLKLHNKTTPSKRAKRLHCEKPQDRFKIKVIIRYQQVIIGTLLIDDRPKAGTNCWGKRFKYILSDFLWLESKPKIRWPAHFQRHRSGNHKFQVKEKRKVLDFIP